jgi:tetratricopeptide (TPR) repeat protein
MDARAVVEILRGGARLCRAMDDSLLAIDLYDLSARVAVRAAIGAVDPADPRRADLDAILAGERGFPIFTLTPQATGYPPLSPAASERLAALGALLDRAFDGARILSWPLAREICQSVRACAGALPCALDAAADPGPLWQLALAALEELLAVTPIPLALEPVADVGQHARDKAIYWLPGSAAEAGSGLQDAGWAYDRLQVDRDRLAIARMVLPPLALTPYLRRHAEHHFDRGDFATAERHIREALAINPNAEDHNALLRYLLASPRADDRAFFAESRRWAALYAGEERLAQVVYRNDRDPERPLRVGYMCDFIHTQLAQHSLVPMFEAHDRARIAVHYYNHGVDSLTARAVSDVYHDVSRMTDDQVFRQIQDDRVDLLIDLNGRLRTKNRYDVLCRKPAPVQINWYNLLASTGLQAFDFLITEEVSLPREKQPLCTEEIVYLDCQVGGTWRLPEDPPVARQPCFEKGVFVFASFGAAFKTNVQVLDLWVRMLREIPNTILFLKNQTFYTPAFKRQIRDYFVTRGVPAQRLRLEHRSEFHQMRALYADVDLCVDTFPYSNGSTTSNALWQGVPTVTLLTDEWRGRTTAGVMADAGLNEFVARTPDEYLERARYYVAHPERLAEIRASIRQRLIASSGLFNVARFTRDLEVAYRYMWRRWLQREAERAA